MKRASRIQCLRGLWPLLLLASLLHAQDAGMVLRTSVTYNTQKATLPLTPEQRREAEDLQAQAQEANRAGDYANAMRLMHHGLAVMAHSPWTPAREFASSLTVKVDHAVLEPGRPVTLKFSRLYETPRASGLKLSAELAIAPARREDGARRPLGAAVEVNPSAPFEKRVELPELPVGDYTLEVRLSDEGQPAPRAPFAVKLLAIHIDKLATDVERLRARLAKAPKKDGIATAEYALALYAQADSGEVNPARVNFREEFASANAVLDALEAGRNPFAGKHGDFHRAYRSAVDNTLQPYRLFIPASYDAAKAAPLLVALHGMGGDENSLFDSYDKGALKREAERVGFIVICPKGRDSASMYRGSAERDVLDAMADVRHEYRIDAARIYLMGHSMGAYGTWSIAMNHPEIFAALGPISGGGSAAGMAKIRGIPQYVVHGDDDRTVPVAQSRTMVEAARKLGTNVVYVEVPDGSHTSVAAPAFAAMLDFFVKQVKGSQ